MDATIGQYIAAHYPHGLHSGAHTQASGEACALEAYSQYLGMSWTDNPATLGIWDVRALNDIRVDAHTRTELMIPLLSAYAGSAHWSQSRQQGVITPIAIQTVREIVSRLPGLPPTIARQCEQASTLLTARAAGWAAAQCSRATARIAAAAAGEAAGISAGVSDAAEWSDAAAQAAQAAQFAASGAGVSAGASDAAEWSEWSKRAAQAAEAAILRTVQRFWLDAAIVGQQPTPKEG